MNRTIKACLSSSNIIPVIHAENNSFPAEINEEAKNKINPTFQSHVVTNVSHALGLQNCQSNSSLAEPFKQEIDLIRMKAGTLLRSHGIQFKSLAEALNSVREAPIQAKVDIDNRIATLCLTLVLPNATVKVEGSFRRDSHGRILVAPISNSFHLSILPASILSNSSQVKS